MTGRVFVQLIRLYALKPCGTQHTRLILGAFCTDTHTHTHSLSLTHTHTLSLSLSHTHTLSLSLCEYLLISHARTHTHTHTHTQSVPTGDSATQSQDKARLVGFLLWPVTVIGVYIAVQGAAGQAQKLFHLALECTHTHTHTHTLTHTHAHTHTHTHTHITSHAHTHTYHLPLLSNADVIPTKCDADVTEWFSSDVTVCIMIFEPDE